MPRRPASALAIVVLALTACGAGSEGGDGAALDGASTAAPGSPSAPPALQFVAPLVGGGEIDAASLAGRPVLFWFWAPY